MNLANPGIQPYQYLRIIKRITYNIWLFSWSSFIEHNSSTIVFCKIIIFNELLNFFILKILRTLPILSYQWSNE